MSLGGGDFILFFFLWRSILKSPTSESKNWRLRCRRDVINRTHTYWEQKEGLQGDWYRLYHRGNWIYSTRRKWSVSLNSLFIGDGNVARKTIFLYFIYFLRHKMQHICLSNGTYRFWNYSNRSIFRGFVEFQTLRQNQPQSIKHDAYIYRQNRATVSANQVGCIYIKVN